MSIDFTKVTELSDQYGNIVEVTDEAGNVLWSAWSTSGNVILEVEKITSDTYAGSTTYTGEQFILLDIYPKTNGTVTVTYGGLTKTITDTSGAEEPNAQQVFFGTFNGVTDGVATPASGTLTIEGDYAAFGCGNYNVGKYVMARCSCVTGISDFGAVEYIPDYAFYMCEQLTKAKIPSSVTSIGTRAFSGCTGLTSILVNSDNEYYSSEGGILFSKDKTVLYCYPSASGNYAIPSSVTSIGDYAFDGCTGLTSVTIPSSVTSIGNYVFYGCTGLTSVTIPSSVTSIGNYAFAYCTGLTSVTFDNTSGWYVTTTQGATSGTDVNVTDAANNVTLITSDYVSHYWYRTT